MTVLPTYNQYRLDRFICAVSLLMRTHSGSDSGSRTTLERSRLSHRRMGLELGNSPTFRLARLMLTIPRPGWRALLWLNFGSAPRSSADLCQRQRLQLSGIFHKEKRVGRAFNSPRSSTPYQKMSMESPVVAVGDSGFETSSQLPTDSKNLVINAKVVLTG